MKFKRFLRLICLTMGLMWAGSMSATEFIKADFFYSWDKVESWSIGKLNEAGYTRLVRDLNAGCGKKSGYLYLGYKTTTNPAEACTDIMFFSSKSNNAPDTKVYNGKTYHKLTNGWCGGDCNFKWDFNTNAGGHYIYLYWTSDGNTKEGTECITSISTTGDASASNLAKVFDGGAANMNQDAGGDKIYIVVNKGHKHQVSTYKKYSLGQHEKICSCGLNLGKENHDNKYKGGTCKCGFEHNFGALRFTAEENNSTVKLTMTSSVSLKYTTDDGMNWYDYTSGKSITLAKDKKLYIHATSTNATMNGCQFAITGKVKATGDLTTLIDRRGTSTISANAFKGLFKGCTGLTTSPELPATTLGESCYESLFEGCTSLTYYPNLKAKNLAKACYKNMFKGCTALTKAPELNATTLYESCYESMFEGSKVSYFGGLPATTLAKRCYYRMFQNTALSSMPYIYATDLADYCCYEMFDHCASLSSTTELKATTMTPYCYNGMFRGCSSMTSAPALPATVLAERCYSAMFEETGLTSTPTLPATTLTSYCYAWMFKKCKSLTTASALSATSLAQHCYDAMFYEDTNLERAPYLPATTLSSGCYNEMFRGCSKLNSVAVAFNYWSNDCTTNWLYGVASQGTFIAPATLPTSTRSASYVPSGWVVNPDYLCFTAEEAGSTVAMEKDGSSAAPVSLEYSTDRISWSNFAVGSTKITLANVGDKVYLRAKDKNEKFNASGASYRFKLSGKVAASGNIMSLLDVYVQQKSVPEYAFLDLFNYCVALTSAPELPATTLALGCYNWMFGGCTSLTQAPELPATTLNESCYQQMFSGCTALTEAPALPATELAASCYEGLFEDCTSLRKAPALPATQLAPRCYASMFKCSNLNSCVLPAEQLAEECYQYMFDGCDKLSSLYVNFSDWSDELHATDGWLTDAGADLSRAQTVLSFEVKDQFICPDDLAQQEGRLPEKFEYNSFATTIKLNASGYATYSSPVYQEVEEGAKIAACEIKDNFLVLHEMPAFLTSRNSDYGYLLVGEPNAEVKLKTTLGKDAGMIDGGIGKDVVLPVNHLHATTDRTCSVVPKEEYQTLVSKALQALNLEADITPYALNGSKFYKYTGSEFVHGKSYLANYDWMQIISSIRPNPGNYNVSEMRMVWDYELEEEETNGISQVRPASERKSPAYDLSGRKTDSQRGLMLRDGKVVLSK